MTSKHPARKEHNMKRLIFAAGLFVATVSTSLYAQTMDMRASIPFDFRIGSTVLPSGDYVIRNSGVVLFVSQVGGSHKSGIVMTVGEDHPNTSASNGTLLFTRYGEAYYLSKVWVQDNPTARALPKTPREKELASHIGLSGTASVSLRTK
jgi:hypothetical protein